jgi:hypothetical protein
VRTLRGKATEVKVRLFEGELESGWDTTSSLCPGHGVQARGDGPVASIVGARYVPTPQRVVEAMLALAEVTQQDVVCDPGCGDGRLVVTAARRYGAHGVGIDVDAWCIEECRRSARHAGVEHLVSWLHADAMDVDLSPMTVVTLYMPRQWNQLFLPKLQRELSWGSRIVAYTYELGDWPPCQTLLVPDQYGRESPVYLWRAGALAVREEGP